MKSPDVPGYADGMKLMSFGLRKGFEGLRTGDVRLILLGALLLALHFLRRSPSRELVYEKRLRPGQSLDIRLEAPE